MRVGFIGLGSQGGPDGATDRRRRLRPDAVGPPARHPRTVRRHRREDRRDPLPSSRPPVTWSACASSATTTSERCSSGDTGVLAGLAPGGIVAIHSTVHPDTCREIAKSAAEQGVSVIDAPVSGGAPAVEEGKLLVMVGGDDDVVERCRPVFATYADPIVHLGPLGSGQVTKILNNLLFTANLGSATEHPRIGRIPWHFTATGSARSSPAGRRTARRSAASPASEAPSRSHRVRSQAHCCRRTSGTPRASPTARRRPQGAVFDAADCRAGRRWNIRDDAGRLRRRRAHGRTHGAPPGRSRPRCPRARPHARETRSGRGIGCAAGDRTGRAVAEAADVVDRLRVHRRAGAAGLPGERPRRRDGARRRRSSFTPREARAPPRRPSPRTVSTWSTLRSAAARTTSPRAT